MCGIFGVFNVKPVKPVDEGLGMAALNVLLHRGPDAHQVLRINDHLLLGHTRLSIIDLVAESNQPMTYGDLHITFNGEIYNYIELREQLVAAGYHFRTKSDTEVILASYKHWGEACVKRFNGMWAFAIYDAQKNTMFCSRDRFGVKPFNFHFANGRFIFSSEIKAIIKYDPSLCVPNYSAISNYCRETVGAQSDETWFSDIRRLPPATNMVVSSSGVSTYAYWDYPSTLDTSLSFDQAVASYRDILTDAVRIRMRSDVTVGCTLSGGLDSTTIAYEMSKCSGTQINTYTASFPGRAFDETPVARQFAEDFNLKGHDVLVDYSRYVENLKTIVYHLESAHGSPAIYPLWAVTKRAQEDITVFLEGQGADELLAGYINSVFVDFFLEQLQKGNVTNAIAELNKHRRNWPLYKSVLLYYRQTLGRDLQKLYRVMQGMEKIYAGPLENYHRYELKRNESQKFGDLLNRRLYKQHQTGLVNLLHYGDAISMMHSLENRLPFLDYRLVEFVFKLPGKYKVAQGYGKYIHRVAYQENLPHNIVFNKSKLGFVSPLDNLFDKGSAACDVIYSDEFRRRGLFHFPHVETLVQKHQKRKEDNSRMLFKILSTELWFRNFIDNAK